MPKKNRILDDLGIAVCIFLTLSPFYIWGHEGVVLGMSLFVFLFCSRSSFKSMNFANVQAALLVFVFSYCFLILNGASYLGSVFFSVILFVFTLMPIERTVNIFKLLKIIIAISLLPGLMMWLLHHFLDKNIFYLGALPVDLMPNEFKKDAGQGYAIYPFSVVLDYMLELPFYRMQGPFDEPGWLGTICVLLIAAEGFDKRRITDYIILFSGFLSFSLAFYILISIYSLTISSKNILKYYFLIIILSSFVCYFAFDVIDNYILQRLAITDSGISGYNRDGEILNEKFSNLMNAPFSDILLGSSEKIFDGSSGFKQLIVNSGLIGIFLIFSIYFISIYLNKNLIGKKFAIFVIIFFLSSLQRPDVVKPFMFFIFLASPFMLKFGLKGK